jgi:DmsE family decaheme c-type cytochrome
MSDDRFTRLRQFSLLLMTFVIALALGMLSYCSAAAAAPAQAPETKLPIYVGSQACTACHKEAAHAFSETMMGKIFLKNARDERERHGCETCHGPGSLYMKDMAAAMGKGIKPGPGHGPSKDGLITFRKDSGESGKADNAVCLTCHEVGARAFWQASTHAERGLRCVDCHTIMRKLSPNFQLAVGREVNPFLVKQAETQVCLRCHLRKRMEINLPSHMPIREGLMTCTDCHNSHGGPYPHQLIRATVNEVCYQCHAERRGPFLWPHPPVMINCLNCHTPHGSVNRFLLKVNVPRLCQQCHIGTYHPGTPANINTPFVFNRACTNCHAHIHGSNSPGGRVFTR